MVEVRAEAFVAMAKRAAVAERSAKSRECAVERRAKNARLDARRSAKRLPKNGSAGVVEGSESPRERLEVRPEEQHVATIEKSSSWTN